MFLMVVSILAADGSCPLVLWGRGLLGIAQEQNKKLAIYLTESFDDCSEESTLFKLLPLVCLAKLPL